MLSVFRGSVSVEIISEGHGTIPCDGIELVGSCDIDAGSGLIVGPTGLDGVDEWR
jgi:hypothetical protein